MKSEPGCSRVGGVAQVIEKTGLVMKKKRMSKKRVLSTTRAPIVSTREYANMLFDLKKQIQEAQVKAILAVNTELIKLYWHIGEVIAEKQKISGWGSGAIQQLARDLQIAFPGISGFSRANIFYMRAFYLAYAKVQQPVGLFTELPMAKISWGHNIVLITKLKRNEERLWYAQKSIENGWSRVVLELQIESNLYARAGKGVTNFKNTLPAPYSDMAQQALKDPYLFDFLALHDDYVEHDIEQGLVDNVQELLLEMGKGFSFVGRQYHLQVGDQDFYIDLLFYHIRLQCFFVVELKARKFDPRDAGQLNFYLSAVDQMLRGPNDKPTIGLLLCKSKDNLVAEYALRDINKPIGIAGYKASLLAKLPKNLKSSLPTIKEIEAELAKRDVLGELELGRQKKTKNGSGPKS